MNKEIKTRMAPSPTGFLHVGGLRTALFNYLLARKNNGKFILRMEDTDQSRQVPGALENILQSLADFKLHPDEGMYWDNGVKEKGELGPYKQSDRLDIYQKYAKELIDKKTAYYCFCAPERLKKLREDQQSKKQPPKYDKFCLGLSPEELASRLEKADPYVIRLDVPMDKTIVLNDLVHGKIEFSSNEIDDQVLIKSDGYPTYHLAVVVDDHLMGITHVVRGDEWIPSTPKHILLYESLGWELPKFIHLPLLLSKSRKKLSKRDGDVAVKDFLAQGYLPEALINFVAFLGWNPKSTQEIFSLNDLVNEFAVERINKAGAVFDLEKLDWINGLYIRDLDVAELMLRVSPFLKEAGINIEDFETKFFHKILNLEKDRLKKLSEIGERVQFFFKDPLYETDLLLWKETTKQTILKNLGILQIFLQSLPENKFTKNKLEDSIKTMIEDNGLKNGEVLWPLRVALSGLKASPGPFEIMDVFASLSNGKELILKRINNAIEKLFKMC